MVIDLGCGETKIAGAVGVDNVALPSVDIVHDLLVFPYPFDTESADEIYLNHVIEHFVLNNIEQLLNEVHRILKPDGVVHIRVPHVFSIAAWIDITHKTYFTFGSVEFWSQNSSKAYYAETSNRWSVIQTSARVTWFNWKRYRLRQVDEQLSKGLSVLLNWFLRQSNWPGSADLLVKALPIFFVEIQWELRKATLSKG